jgi:hypothetical protein
MLKISVKGQGRRASGGRGRGSGGGGGRMLDSYLHSRGSKRAKKSIVHYPSYRNELVSMWQGMGVIIPYNTTPGIDSGPARVRTPFSTQSTFTTCSNSAVLGRLVHPPAHSQPCFELRVSVTLSRHLVTSRDHQLSVRLGTKGFRQSGQTRDLLQHSQPRLQKLHLRAGK